VLAIVSTLLYNCVMPAFDVPKFEMPKFEMPKFEMPKFEMPNIDLPKVDLPDIDADKLAALARDAFYVSVGFGVLAVQKAQVRRQELAALMTERVNVVVEQVRTLVGKAA
jgi:hypothetical protein